MLAKLSKETENMSKQESGLKNKYKITNLLLLQIDQCKKRRNKLRRRKGDGSIFKL